jgi:hypothetical protein
MSREEGGRKVTFMIEIGDGASSVGLAGESVEFQKFTAGRRRSE